ncbi:hypothetical protein [uncultured Endozoicomonas sp.]|uniref:hypothetical protein n=1 Tax=uncultured Endozoicomonas sp. TaxID=432652 RepID=UPI00262C3DFB|nr:hypothetical protein [uncultured Endozoicomonas sp.]
MKTRDLLKLPDAKLAAAISTMKSKECEKHLRNYTKILGIEFEMAIMQATHAAMFSDSDEPVKLRTYKAVVDLVRSETEYGEKEAVILAALLLAHISKKIDKVQSLVGQTQVPAFP